MTAILTDEGTNGHLRRVQLTEAPASSRFTTEHLETYVLIKASKTYGSWMHPEHGLVLLCNVHGTGEIRWYVNPNPAEYLGPEDRRAVRHFGVYPANRSEASWAEEMKETEPKWDGLNDVEQKLLQRIDHPRKDPIKIVKSMRFTNEDGEKVYVIRNSPESQAAYSLQGKGLAKMGVSWSGPGFYEMSHVYSERVFVSITNEGIELLRKERMSGRDV